MDGERQLTESLGGGLIDLTGFDAAARAFEAQAQGDVLIAISKRAQETPDLLRASVCLLDDAQRGRDGDFFRNRGLEHRAIELLATLRPLGVDAAAAILAQRGAGLREAGFRLQPFDGQAKGRQLFRVIARLQLDIPEEHAVAAHAAGETEGGWKFKVQRLKLKGSSKAKTQKNIRRSCIGLELGVLSFT